MWCGVGSKRSESKWCWLTCWVAALLPLTLPSPPGGEGRVRGSGSGRVQGEPTADPEIKELATLKVGTFQVLSLAFAPDGKTLAVGSHQNNVLSSSCGTWLAGRN